MDWKGQLTQDDNRPLGYECRNRLYLSIIVPKYGPPTGVCAGGRRKSIRAGLGMYQTGARLVLGLGAGTLFKGICI